LWAGHYNIDRVHCSNGLNQLTSAGATAQGDGPRGNLTSSSSSSYSYTSKNRMNYGASLLNTLNCMQGAGPDGDADL
jgi:hypothetical protein